MTDYGQMAEVTPEEKELILQRTPIVTRNLVDPETADRREAARKKEREQRQREQAESLAEYEAKSQRDQERVKGDMKSELLRRGWTKWGLPAPNQKFYNFAPCIWNCGTECAYIADVSPNVEPTDSLYLPYSKQKEDDHKNFPDQHLCENLGPATAIIKTLLNEIVNLKEQQAKNFDYLKNYAMWSGMR